MVMLSGLVCVGILTAFGRSTLTVLVITGIVMRKMISSTSITSTSGVVLMLDITLGSSELGPTLIDMSYSSRAAAAAPTRCVARTPFGSRRNSLADRRGFGGRRAGAAHAVGRHTRATDKIGMQVAGKVPQGILQELVAAQQPVITHDRRYRDEQTDGRHDERLTDRTSNPHDARLPGDAYRHQRVQNAPDRTEQA